MTRNRFPRRVNRRTPFASRPRKSRRPFLVVTNRFLSIHEPQGLLFAEAEFGSLQSYIDDHFHSMSAKEKMVFRLQASEAIAFIHSQGVIHSDLRPDNFLVCSGRDGTRSLRLCDFGGSTYRDLDGDHLPDAGSLTRANCGWRRGRQTSSLSHRYSTPS